MFLKITDKDIPKKGHNSLVAKHLFDIHASNLYHWQLSRGQNFMGYITAPLKQLLHIVLWYQSTFTERLESLIVF